jgi:integrase
MLLTNTKVLAAKPRSNPYKLFDEKGLYLLIQPSGSRYWRMKYYFGGKEKGLALGVFPEVSLKAARERRDDARKLLSSNSDPGVVKRLLKAGVIEAHAATFELVAREWFDKQQSKWVKSHSSKIIRRLELHVFPWIGNRPVSELSAREILITLQRIEKKAAIETAHRALNICDAVFRYAVQTSRTTQNPVRDLKGALLPSKETHRAAITDPAQVGGLMRAIRGYRGTDTVRAALLLAPLLFVRPGELRHAEWTEIELENSVWKIPAEKMKMRQPHVVPLSLQSVAALTELRKITGTGKYVFPGIRDRKRPMSENTINAALRNLGYQKDEMTGHGFRAMASTLLNEAGFTSDHIERQLAHTEGNSVRAAYNHANYFSERKKMMQWWADRLETLENGAKMMVRADAE